MASAEQLNSFLVDMFGRINKIEERTMAGGLGSAISITEIHIIEKIGAREPLRMGELARLIGVTLATLTVACDKLEADVDVIPGDSAHPMRHCHDVLTPDTYDAR